MQDIPLAEIHDVAEELGMNATSSAFKAEVLGEYGDHALYDASLVAWRSGNLALAQHHFAELSVFQRYKNYRMACPGTRQRIHAVTFPISDYVRFEIDVPYHSYVQEDVEEVGLADKALLGNIELPPGDFWVWDDERVLAFDYHPETLKTVRATVYESGDDIQPFLIAKQALLQIHKPLAYDEHGRWVEFDGQTA
jgi:hypothetical protein